MKTRAPRQQKAAPAGIVDWKDQKRHPANGRYGEWLKQRRAERHWSLADMAGHMGISRSYLSGLEKGRHSPTLEVMLRAERVLGRQAGGPCLDIREPDASPGGRGAD